MSNMNGGLATEQIDRMVDVGTRLADLAAREQLLIAQRPVKKLEAIDRIMGRTEVVGEGEFRQTIIKTNPRTNKAHTFSSAEQEVETDAEYAAFLAEQARALREKLLAQAEYAAAKLRAQLSVALLLGD